MNGISGGEERQHRAPDNGHVTTTSNGRASRNGRIVPKGKPDDFEEADGWLYIVVDPDDASSLRNCVPHGLDVCIRRIESSSAKSGIGRSWS